MWFERFDTAYLLIAAALVGLGVAHYWLSRLHAWAGIIVPAIYLCFVVWVIMKGFNSLIDIGLLALGFLALAGYWAKAREAAGKKKE